MKYKTITSLLLFVLIFSPFHAFADSSCDLSEGSMTLSFVERFYDGSPHCPEVTVTDAEGALLVEGQDYTISILNEDEEEVSDYTAVGSYLVIAHGAGRYRGETCAPFYILSPHDIVYGELTLTETVLVYDGQPQLPLLTVTSHDGTLLREVRDYLVSFERLTDREDWVWETVPACVEVGEYRFAVSGTGRYTGLTYSPSFEILSSNDLGLGQLELSEWRFAYDGKSHLPQITVSDRNGVRLIEGQDYRLYIENEDLEPVTACVLRGWYTVYVLGEGEYCGQLADAFCILPPNDISLGTVELSASSFVFDGTDRRPQITIHDREGRLLREDMAYLLDFWDADWNLVSSCVSPGLYYVTITGVGDYTGEDYTSFRIVSEPTRTPGDVNGDGVVNGKDVTRLCRFLAGYSVEIKESNADVNGDGVVNGKDLTRLCRALAGYAVSLQ